jgi:hypothetical protein
VSTSLAPFGAPPKLSADIPGVLHLTREVRDGEAPSPASEALAFAEVVISPVDVER